MVYTPSKSKPGEDVMKFFNKKTYNLHLSTHSSLDPNDPSTLKDKSFSNALKLPSSTKLRS